MANKGLKIDERRRLIAEYIAQKGEVRVSELSEKYGTSGVTIRNDLDALEASGYLKRVSGGAVHNVNNFYNLNLLKNGNILKENSSNKGSQIWLKRLSASFCLLWLFLLWELILDLTLLRGLNSIRQCGLTLSSKHFKLSIF